MAIKLKDAFDLLPCRTIVQSIDYQIALPAVAVFGCDEQLLVSNLFATKEAAFSMPHVVAVAEAITMKIT